MAMCVAGARNATGALAPAGMVTTKESPAGTAIDCRSPSPMLRVPPVTFPSQVPADMTSACATAVNVENAAAAKTAISVVRETDALMHRTYDAMSERRHDQGLGS